MKTLPFAKRWALATLPLWALACSEQQAVVGGRTDGGDAQVDVTTGDGSQSDVTSDKAPVDVTQDAPADVPGDAPEADAAGDVADDASDASDASDDAPSDAAPCGAGETRCGERCAATATDPQNCGACGRACESGQSCVMGACACAAGNTTCGGRCVDPMTDPLHCGACDRACPSGEACVAGMCACPMGQTRCGGRCVDTQTANAHCGMCDRACGAGQSCAAGTCACPSGQARCGDACVDTQSSDAHCGACGRQCAADQRCVMGACACATGQTRCGDACVDTQTSDAHCGACGTRCAAGLRCAMGACVCPEGQTRCGDRCVDTRSDRAHCGACNAACPAGQVCDSGACRLDCTAPEVLCASGASMVCVNTASNAQHCGRCGNACATPAGASSAVCRMGACAPVCSAGRGDCDAMPANGCETDVTTTRNCGRCGNACPATAPGATSVVCASGGCAPVCAAGRGDCDRALGNGCETDTNTSVTHCGACGRACAAGLACVAGRCLERSCAGVRASTPTAASGVYRIDPDGPGGQADFDVYCDMTTAGGGWTLVATVYNSLPTDTRRWNTNLVFQDDSSFGDLGARTTDDMKSPAYARVQADDLLVLTDEYHFGFRAMLERNPMASYVRARVSDRCSTTWIRSGADFVSTNVPMNVQRALGFTIRGLDVNGGGPSGGCAVNGSNENSFLNFLAGPSWWVFGVGNCVNCAGGWTSYDNGMLNLRSIATGACTAGSWPCNANGLWWQSGLYPSNPDTKTRYVQLLVR